MSARKTAPCTIEAIVYHRLTDFAGCLVTVGRASAQRRRDQDTARSPGLVCLLAGMLKKSVPNPVASVAAPARASSAPGLRAGLPAAARTTCDTESASLGARDRARSVSAQAPDLGADPYGIQRIARPEQGELADGVSSNGSKSADIYPGNQEKPGLHTATVDNCVDIVVKSPVTASGRYHSVKMTKS